MQSKHAPFVVIAVIGAIAALLAAPAILEYRDTDAATIAAVRDSKFYLLGAALLFALVSYWLGTPEKRRQVEEQFQRPPLLPRRTITIIAAATIVPILAAHAAIPLLVDDARTRKLFSDLLAPAGVLMMGICVVAFQHRAALKRDATGPADNIFS